MINWIVANIVGLVPLLVLFGLGVGYLIRRQLSGQAHIEDQESLERTIRLKQLMDTEGMSLDELKELRDKFRNSRGGLIGVEARTLIEKKTAAEVFVDNTEATSESGKIAFDETTAGMAIKAGAELDNLNGQLAVAVGELTHELSERRASQLFQAQETWETFRAAEAEYAALLFEGGTGAKLIRLAKMIELTEQRLRELALYQAEKDL
ncbi:hypothetical protein CHH26_07250 [Qipengyuania flava]|uniref:lysozyme inhibitor LprI family protein n=1 Tax=Qipengyuania flava TaxID=192812 RepID=UPI000B8C2B6F|nr:lysozyme inhibitor LprI family protein [Qipengyuania flava]ASP30049.1 hypothetical protein CHH26_07250 [Qipengyuania flava]